MEEGRTEKASDGRFPPITRKTDDEDHEAEDEWDITLNGYQRAGTTLPKIILDPLQ